MQHILKYADNDDAVCLIRAFGCILSESMSKTSHGFIRLSNKDQWNDTNIVCQDNPIYPCLFELKNIYWNDTDIYTMNINEVDPIVHIAGGYAFGNFENVAFPVYNPYQDNFITDTFASSFGTLMKEDFTGAYALLRLGQLLLTFAKENANQVPQTDTGKRGYVPKLYKYGE